MNTASFIGSTAAIIGACSAMALAAFNITPDPFKIHGAASAFFGTLVLIIFGVLIYKFFSPARKWFSQGVPALKRIGVILLLPLAAFLLLDNSWESALFGAVVAAFIILIVFLSRDRRQIYPFPQIRDDVEFQWIGIRDDHVGMGAGGLLRRDKHPDGAFCLLVDKTYSSIKQITIKRLNGRGNEAGQIWTTRQTNNWAVAAITEGGDRINESRQDDLQIPTKDHARIYLYISDVAYLPSGWFLPGQIYRVDITYFDGSKDVDITYTPTTIR